MSLLTEGSNPSIPTGEEMDHKNYRVVFHPEIPQERVDEARQNLYPSLDLDAYDDDARDTVLFTFNNIVREILHYQDADPEFGKIEYDDYEGQPLIDVLVQTGLAKSRGDARRLCEQGGIRVNGERVTNLDTEFDGDTLLTVGKKRRVYVRL